MSALIRIPLLLLTIFVGSVPAKAGIIINEVLADPPSGLAGDANGDGIRNGIQDEFVELVNTSATALDISGWTISDGIGTRHQFDAGTVIYAYAAILVFGGGAPYEFFSGAQAFTASTGVLGLNNSGDQVSLFDAMSSPIDAMTYGAEGNDDQSLTLDPELDWTGAAFVRHATATGSRGAALSPGTRVDGTPFGPAEVPEPGPLLLIELGLCYFTLKKPSQIRKSG